MTNWLYEHFKMYEQLAVVDLDYHRVNIVKLIRTKNGKLKEEKATVTQAKAIRLVEKYLKRYFKCGYQREEEAVRYLQTALRIVAEVAPMMWW